MAAKGRDRLLPLPCDPGKHRSVECLWTTPTAIVVALSASPQSTASRVGSHAFGLRPMDSSPSRFASLSSDPLSRYSSKVGAVCVEALVRICAGGYSVTIVPTASASSISVSCFGFRTEVAERADQRQKQTLAEKPKSIGPGTKATDSAAGAVTRDRP